MCPPVHGPCRSYGFMKTALPLASQAIIWQQPWWIRRQRWATTLLPTSCHRPLNIHSSSSVDTKWMHFVAGALMAQLQLSAVSHNLANATHLLFASRSSDWVQIQPNTKILGFPLSFLHLAREYAKPNWITRAELDLHFAKLLLCIINKSLIRARATTFGRMRVENHNSYCCN